MPSFDNVLQRVLRDEGWDVSPGPAEGSLIAESGGERVLLQWSRADGPGEPETITAQADARPADETSRADGAEAPSSSEPDAAAASSDAASEPAAGGPGAELLGADDGGSEAASDAGSSEAGSSDPGSSDAGSSLVESAVQTDQEAETGRPGVEEASTGGAEIIDATPDPGEAQADGPASGADPGAGSGGGAGGEAGTDAGEPVPEADLGADAGTVDGPGSADDVAEVAGSPTRTARAREAEVTDEVPDEVPVVRLRVDREEASSEAQPKLVDVHDTVLELVPHRAFQYTCRVPDGTGDVETYRGNVLLNALTESAVTLEAPRFAEGVPQGARLLEPEVDVEGAVAEARAHLRDRFTRDVQVEEKTGNVSMMETKRVSPDDDGVDLDNQGVWYVPVWRVEGENGTLRIDANRGEVLDESLQQETGTDAEWVA